MVERVALYSRVLPPGDNIPVELENFEVKDAVPEEGEIEWAVKRLHNNYSGGRRGCRRSTSRDGLRRSCCVGV